MTASDHALELATIAARAASDKLGQDIVAIDVSDHLVITDVFVVASSRAWSEAVTASPYPGW